MKKFSIVWLVFFGFLIAIPFTFTANAQQAGYEENLSEADDDTATVVSALDNLLPEILEEQTDSPVSSFLLKDRFEILQNQIPLRYNEYSHRYVDFFVDRRQSFTRRMLETKDVYFPVFERKLAEHKLPDELKYLPLIESGLDPRIISRAGAGGLWQFMRATGREFGLQQNSYVDERFHPEKSTEAACKYLRQLYKIFGDWEMALAAYNCGPGNIRRAIRRTGKSDFWGIYPVLPKETRNYVPQFVAMVYLMNYAKDHGIAPNELKLIPVSDTVRVNGYLNLHTFAALGGLSMEDIYEHNPHIIGTSIPQSGEEFCLRVPSTSVALMANNLVAILDSSAKVPANGAVLLANSRTVKNGYETITTSARHTVKNGQTLSSIARQHGVSVSELRAWNGLKGSMIRKGQRLVVKKSIRRPVREQEVNQAPVVLATKKAESKEDTATKVAVTAAGVNKNNADATAVGIVASNAPMTESALLERQASRLQAKSKEEVSGTVKAARSANTEAAKSEPSTIRHKIKPGESLTSIAHQYNVEIEDIMKQNSLAGTRLVAGKTLEIQTVVPAATTAARKSQTQTLYHVVQSGDTLWAISRKYGLSVDKIKKVNKIKGNALKAGMKILISG